MPKPGAWADKGKGLSESQSRDLPSRLSEPVKISAIKLDQLVASNNSRAESFFYEFIRWIRSL